MRRAHSHSSYGDGKGPVQAMWPSRGYICTMSLMSQMQLLQIWLELQCLTFSCPICKTGTGVVDLRGGQFLHPWEGDPSSSPDVSVGS